MTLLGFLAFSLFNLWIIDLFARLLVRHTRETRDFKTAGILGLFILAFMYKGVKLFNRGFAIRRYGLSVAIAIILSGILYILLSHHPSHDLPPQTLLLCLLPLLAMPLYHLIFGLLGERPLALMSSTKNFRLRGAVALVMGANVVFAFLNTSGNSSILAIEASFAFLAATNVLYQLGRMRAKSTFFTIDREDSDAGPVGFFYYLSSLLEFYFYCVVLYQAMLGKFLNVLAPNLEPWLGLASLCTIYTLAFILAKILMISRSAIGLSFYERGILPLSFLLFGMMLIAEHYW